MKKTIIHLAECQKCGRPLAAVYPGEPHGYFLPIDGMVLDFGGHGLIWCDKCGAVLPVPTQAAASERRELQP